MGRLSLLLNFRQNLKRLELFFVQILVQDGLTLGGLGQENTQKGCIAKRIYQ